MITGVKLIKSSKVNSFINLLIKTKPNSNNNVKTQHTPVIISNREKWDSNNALRLYHKYFAVFSFETIHSFAYISDYLEMIYYETIYENAYFSHYKVNYKN